MVGERAELLRRAKPAQGRVGPVVVVEADVTYRLGEALIIKFTLTSKALHICPKIQATPDRQEYNLLLCWIRDGSRVHGRARGGCWRQAGNMCAKAAPLLLGPP